MQFLKHKFIGIALAGLSAVALAVPVFVGSYQVDDGPNWQTNPTVYSAEEAAALIFGGNPGDYMISTVNDVNNITGTGWYSIIGVADGTEFAQDFSRDLGDAGYGTNWSFSDGPLDISAYVDDNAIGPQYTNYVFADNGVQVPEPGTMALLGIGLLGLGLARRKRKVSV